MENSREFKIYKCNGCGALIKAIDDCKCENGCGFECCGEKMREVKPNSVDAAVEKHVPTYEVEGDKIVARVNHVMEEDHYIEWMSLVFEDKVVTNYYKPGDEPTLKCKYVPGSVLYAYCNKHELWKKEVE